MARLNAIRVLANIFTMDDFLQFIVLIRVPNLRIGANGLHQLITGHFHAVGCNVIGLASTGRLFQLQQHIVLNLDCVGIDISAAISVCCLNGYLPIFTAINSDLAFVHSTVRSLADPSTQFFNRRIVQNFSG